jgi:hypothetical protein
MNEMPESEKTTSSRLNWVHIVRDVGIVWVLSFLPRLIHARQLPLIYVKAILMGTPLPGIVGFGIAAYFTTNNRWGHLCTVAAGVWLLALVEPLARGQARFGFEIVFFWIVSLVTVVTPLAIGGVLGSALRRKASPPGAISPADTRK